MRTVINKTVINSGLILLLAAGLTVLSLRFVRPATCLELCDTPAKSPCPPQACRFGEQRAGLPIPIVIDDSPGSSPTTGWAKLGPEDVPNPFTFILDVIFFAALIWLVEYFMQWLFNRRKSVEISALVLPIAWVAVCLAIGLYLYLPIYNR